MNYLVPAPEGVDADNGVILITDHQNVLRLGSTSDDDGAVFLFFKGDVLHVGNAEVEHGEIGPCELTRLNMILNSTESLARTDIHEKLMAFVDALIRLGPLARPYGLFSLAVNGEVAYASASLREMEAQRKKRARAERKLAPGRRPVSP